MGTKINQLVRGCISLLLIIFVTTTAFRCEGEKDPEFIVMSFVLPFSVSPAKAEFSIGDTIWVEATFSQSLEEFNSKVVYEVKDFNFQSKIGLFKLINPNVDLSEQPSATDFFSFVVKEGSIPFVGATFSPFTVEYRNGMYFFKAGVVAKAKGVFSINFLAPRDIDLRPGIKLDRSPDGRTRIPAYEWFYFLINEGNTNFDLFKSNCKANSIIEGYDNIPNIYAEQKGTFTFEVK